MRLSLPALFASTLVVALLACTACADVIVSTKSYARLGDVKIERGDLYSYNAVTDSVTIHFDGDLLGRKGDNIDAAHLGSDGSWVLSTTHKSTLAGVEFDRGDLIKYDPITGVAGKMFNQSLFYKGKGKGKGKGWAVDIDAVFVEDSGAIVLSTDKTAMLGGVEFDAGDIVRFDPITEAVSILFDGDLFNRKQNIDAVHIMPNGDIVFSTYGKGGELFGVEFTGGDLVRYNPATLHTELFVTAVGRSRRCGQSVYKDIDAVTFSVAAVPEPATLSLLTIGGLLLMTKRIRTRNA